MAVGVLTKGGHPGIAMRCAPDSGDLYLYFGNGAGEFSAPQYFNLPGVDGRAGLAVGDLDGDGIPDLVSGEGYVARQGRQRISESGLLPGRDLDE